MEMKLQSLKKDILFLGLKRSGIIVFNFLILDLLSVVFLFCFVGIFFKKKKKIDSCFLMGWFELQEDDILREQIRLHGTEK